MPDHISARGRRALAGLLLLAAAGAFAAGLHRELSWEGLRRHLGLLRAIEARHPVRAPAAFFLAYVATTALSLPLASALSLVAGALFGRWLGTAIVSLASTLGATLAMLASRYLLRGWVRGRF